MNSHPIIFIDSGVGGLPYYALARRRLPAERFIYVADRLHYPYGEKNITQIQEDVLATFHLVMERFAPKTAVIACNTASVAALDRLRETFPIPFVGVVPAVKPAAAFTRNKRIGVLATPQTVKNDYLDGLIDHFADGCTVVRIAAPALRDFVEERYFDAPPEERERVLDDAAAAVKEAGTDVLVLSCTHFVHVDEALREKLGSGVTLIDSREGVVSQLERILDRHDLRAAGKDGGGAMYLTGPGPVEERYRRFAQRFDLVLAGPLT
jgi:glutamate racemase